MQGIRATMQKDVATKGTKSTRGEHAEQEVKAIWSYSQSTLCLLCILWLWMVPKFVLSTQFSKSFAPIA